MRRTLCLTSSLCSELPAFPCQHGSGLANVGFSIQYHTALCHLLRPLIGYEGFSKTTIELLRGIVLQNANDGYGYLGKYQALFTNRYQSPLQAFFLVHLCDTLIRERPGTVDPRGVIHFCLDMLEEAQAGFDICGPLQAMFCHVAVEHDLLDPRDMSVLMTGRTYSPEDMLDTCERTTYAQPTLMVLSRLDRKIGEDFGAQWAAYIERYGGPDDEDLNMITNSSRRSLSHGSAGSGDRTMAIDSLVNK